MFKKLTEVVGATEQPNVDCDSITSRAADFEYEYIYVNTVKGVVSTIINTRPDLKGFFCSGEQKIVDLKIKDLDFHDIEKSLKKLSDHNLLEYKRAGGLAITPQGNIIQVRLSLTQKYLDERLRFVS